MTRNGFLLLGTSGWVGDSDEGRKGSLTDQRLTRIHSRLIRPTWLTVPDFLVAVRQSERQAGAWLEVRPPVQQPLLIALGYRSGYPNGSCARRSAPAGRTIGCFIENRATGISFDPRGLFELTTFNVEAVGPGASPMLSI